MKRRILQGVGTCLILSIVYWFMVIVVDYVTRTSTLGGILVFILSIGLFIIPLYISYRYVDTYIIVFLGSYFVGAALIIISLFHILNSTKFNQLYDALYVWDMSTGFRGLQYLLFYLGYIGAMGLCLVISVLIGVVQFVRKKIRKG